MAKDHDLVFLRSENARMRLKEMSGLLKKSPQRLKYSISVLEKQGILSNPHCVFDYSYFGLILFRVYFRGAYVTDRDKGLVIRELLANPHVVSVHELTGEFDLVVEFASPNPSRFNKELKKLSSRVQTLNDYKVVLNLVTHIYPRSYLTRDDGLRSLSSEWVVGGDRESERFSRQDLSLMKGILTEPTAKLTRLSELSGLNPKTVKSSVRNLKARRIIKGFRYVVDTDKLGFEHARLFMRLHNLTQEREAALMRFLLEKREITQMNKTVGDWDMELDIEAFRKSGIRLIMNELRERFKELIERVTLTEVYDCYKKSYLPLFLFMPLQEKPSEQTGVGQFI